MGGVDGSKTIAREGKWVVFVGIMAVGSRLAELFGGGRVGESEKLIQRGGRQH